MKHTALHRYTPLKRSGPPRPRALHKKRARVVVTRYLAWIRTLECLVQDESSPCSGDVESHHVREHGETKDDRKAVPLCVAHHLNGFGPDAVHGIGRVQFEERFGISFAVAIARLNREWKARA